MFAHTIFGQIFPSKEMMLDSCKSGFIKLVTLPNSHQFPSFISNTKTTKGSIVLDSVRYYYPVDQLTTFLYMGVMHYDNYGRRDSIIWFELDTLFNYRNPSEKIEYNYNSSGKILSRYSYGHAYNSSGGVWIKAKGDEYFYNQNGLIVQRKIYTYDSGYRLQYDLNYVYDSLGNLIEHKEEYWNFSHPSNNYFVKKVANYNQNNLLINDTLYQMLNANWFGLNAEVLTYDSLNKLSCLIYSDRLSDSSWYEFNKLEYSINQANLMDTVFKFRRNSFGSWYLAQKFFYGYTATQKLSSFKLVEVNSNGSDLPFFKQNRFYTMQDSLLKIKEYKYDTITQAWKKDKIWENVFDSSGNILYDYNCYWNFYTGLWDSIVNETSIYDESINTNNSNFPVFQNPTMSITEYINPNSNSLLKERKLYDKDIFNGSVIMRGHLTFYYSGIPSGFSEFSEESLYKIYPNPARTYVTVCIPNSEIEGRLNLYDISGRLISSYYIKNKQRISVEGLSSGIYLYTITTDNKFYTGKLCVESK
jgi:hypothetical protein